jgi:cytochrome oxidase assembly protein ShyY1
MNILVFKTHTLKINGFILVFSLLVFSLLIKLGLWQLERAEEKDLRLQQMQVYQNQAALKLDDVARLMSQNNQGAGDNKLKDDLLNDLPVGLSGVFSDQVFLLDNQVHKGRAGYQVIRLFHDEPSAMKVLVNLGWIPGNTDRAIIPVVEQINGNKQFSGKLRVIEPPFVLADEDLLKEHWPQRIQAIYIDKIARFLDINLPPFVVYVDNNESPGYIKEWVPIVMPPEKHRGYAFQWFSLAVAWVVLIVVAAIKSSDKSGKEHCN